MQRLRSSLNSQEQNDLRLVSPSRRIGKSVSAPGRTNRSAWSYSTTVQGNDLSSPGQQPAGLSTQPSKVRAHLQRFTCRPLAIMLRAATRQPSTVSKLSCSVFPTTVTPATPNSGWQTATSTSNSILWRFRNLSASSRTTQSAPKSPDALLKIAIANLQLGAHR